MYVLTADCLFTGQSVSAYTLANRQRRPLGNSEYNLNVSRSGYEICLMAVPTYGLSCCLMTNSNPAVPYISDFSNKHGAKFDEYICIKKGVSIGYIQMEMEKDHPIKCSYYPVKVSREMNKVIGSCNKLGCMTPYGWISSNGFVRC